MAASQTLCSEASKSGGVSGVALWASMICSAYPVAVRLAVRCGCASLCLDSRLLGLGRVVKLSTDRDRRTYDYEQTRESGVCRTGEVTLVSRHDTRDSPP